MVFRTNSTIIIRKKFRSPFWKEPDAVNLLVRICGGGGEVTSLSTRKYQKKGGSQLSAPSILLTIKTKKINSNY